MRTEYDGLEIVKIPVADNDIITASGSCYTNVQNMQVGNVCISEHEGDSYCSEYTLSRHDEWMAPRASGTDFTC